ncbi:MAG: response regulator transcription factor [Rhodobacteraceae bacterium]|jgi:two-component system cell cycle response regulator CtrA|nr:response regulator transcription factor [Paracoccaceae bacterium]
MRVLITETTFATMSLAVDLTRAGLLVTRAADAQDTLAFADHAAQDVAIIDADLPDTPAPALIRKLRTRHPGLAIILTAPRSDLGARLAALDAGADDAVPHGVSAAEVAARIEAIVRRHRGVRQSDLRLGTLTLDLAERQLRVGATVVPLARLEFALFEFLARRTGQVLSREAIMEHLYGLEDSPDQRIITAYVCHIRSKIEAVGGDASVLRNHWGRGYSVAAPGPAGTTLPWAAPTREAAEAAIARLAA